MDSASGQLRFDAELVDLYHRNVPAPVLALNPLLAAVLVFLLSNHVDWELLALWWCAITFVAVLNGWRNIRYRRARARDHLDSKAWRRDFARGALFNGIAWGIGGALLYTPDSPLRSMFALLVICGVAAGSVASQSSLPRAIYSFVFPAILIPASHTLTFVDHEDAALSLLLVTYLAFLLFVARTNYRSLLESIRLRFNNQSLLDALTEREKHFRSLIENALDWVSVVCADGTFRFLSPSVAELLGWLPEELKDRDALMHVHPEDRAQVQKEFQLVLNTGCASAIEARWHHRDGRWILFQGLVRGLGGEEPSLVMNARDVTERRAIERDLRVAKEAAEAANRIKDQFLASMSHEIRTPLHAMQGMADLLYETPLTARQKDYVAGFQQAVGHLTRLVGDVLDFSRMNAGGLTLTHEVFDLRALLDGVIGLMGAQASGKDLALHLEFSPEIAPLHEGDVVRLRQVLVNLVGNAVKFTERGEVRLRVEEKEGGLLFAVRDTGRGIPVEKQDLLFRPFYQVDASSTREFGGAGLGLAISRGLVEAMGGWIKATSEPGVGSEFSFWVKLSLAAKGAIVRSPIEGTSDIPMARILVVDDAELNLMVMREFFRDTPCLLDFAYNGREALAAWQRDHPDLILMDIQMPEMDGWEATRAIRQMEKEQGRKPTPIVALTAGALDEDRAKSLGVGCTDFLSKPVTKSRLLALLTTYLDTKGQGDASTAYLA